MSRKKIDWETEIATSREGIATAYRDAPLESGRAYIWNWIDHVAEPVAVLLGGRKDCVFAHRARNAERKDSRAWTVTHRETGGRLVGGLCSDVARAIVHDLRAEHALVGRAIAGDLASRKHITERVQWRKLGL